MLLSYQILATVKYYNLPSNTESITPFVKLIDNTNKSVQVSLVNKDNSIKLCYFRPNSQNPLEFSRSNYEFPIILHEKIIPGPDAKKGYFLAGNDSDTQTTLSTVSADVDSPICQNVISFPKNIASNLIRIDNCLYAVSTDGALYTVSLKDLTVNSSNLIKNGQLERIKIAHKGNIIYGVYSEKKHIGNIKLFTYNIATGKFKETIPVQNIIDPTIPFILNNSVYFCAESSIGNQWIAKLYKFNIKTGQLTYREFNMLLPESDIFVLNNQIYYITKDPMTLKTSLYKLNSFDSNPVKVLTIDQNYFSNILYNPYTENNQLFIFANFLTNSFTPVQKVCIFTPQSKGRSL